MYSVGTGVLQQLVSPLCVDFFGVRRLPSTTCHRQDRRYALCQHSTQLLVRVSATNETKWRP